MYIIPSPSETPSPSVAPNPSPSVSVMPSPSPTAPACSPEICDGIDNDCNNQTDDGNLCGSGFTCSMGVCEREMRQEPMLSVQAASTLDLSTYTSTKKVTFFAGGKAVAEKQNGVLKYVHDDALGSIIFKTDSTGTLAPSSSAAYDAYGLSQATDSKFTGKPKDSSTGLIYFGARYYDPYVGRFTSADSMGGNIAIPQTLNRYAYVSNNPNYFTDPDGRQQSGVFIQNGKVLKKSDSSEVYSIDSARAALNAQIPDPKHPIDIQENGQGEFFVYETIRRQGHGLNNEFIIPDFGVTKFIGGVSPPAGTQTLSYGRILGREVMAYSISMDPGGLLGKRYSQFAKQVRGKGLSDLEILSKLASFLYLSPANTPLYNLQNELARTAALKSRGQADLGEALFASTIDGKSYGFGATCRPMALAAGAFLEQLCNDGILKGAIENEIAGEHAVVVFRSSQGKAFRVDPTLPLVSERSGP
ncbi:MAG TPA: RHS repeat-associated core domain-containing protein [Candidatus Norongarragalinales archaeon]|nr:RHS repeat-associated core domain-containing protein [Candidatus Norongarragalinales archaeon]